MEEKKIFEIVLTGGPCAGKTKVFDELSKYLIEKGYYVIPIPETATELIKSKIIPNGDRKQVLLFQDLVLKKQFIKETVAETYAKNNNINKPIVILLDRAIIDNRAYLESDDDFAYILKKNNLNGFEILNKYDLVIDLISTANLMPEKYALDGVRFESVQEAKTLDQKTTMAWLGHPNMKIIKPQDNIEDKVNYVINLVINYINGYNYNKKQVKQLNNAYDLSVYNNSNSKKINISNIYLKGNLIVQKRQFKDECAYMLVDPKFSSYKLISKQNANNLVYSNEILYNERQEEINFIYNNNASKIVINKEKKYLESDDEIIVPGDFNLKDSVFIKKRKYDSI